MLSNLRAPGETTILHACLLALLLLPAAGFGCGSRPVIGGIDPLPRSAPQPAPPLPTLAASPGADTNAPRVAMLPTLPADLLPADSGWQPLFPADNLQDWTIYDGFPTLRAGVLDLAPGCNLERPLPYPCFALCGEIRLVHGDPDMCQVAGLIGDRLFFRPDTRLPALVLSPPIDYEPGPTLHRIEGLFTWPDPDYSRPRPHLLPHGEWRVFYLWSGPDSTALWIDDELLFEGVPGLVDIRRIRFRTMPRGRMQLRNLWVRNADH